MDIPKIKTTGISIDNFSINSVNIKIKEIPLWKNYTSSESTLPIAPPVTVNIGVPIVDMPGCVEAHEINDNNKLEEDDPKGTSTFCDSGVPSFNPIDYNKEELQFTGPPKAPVTKTESPTPPTPEVPKAEDVRSPTNTAVVECPTKVQKAQEPVGTLVEGFRKKVVGYELIDKTCVQITEPVPLPTQIVAGLPSGGQVVQVGGVAVIATTSALMAKPLADILLRAVKPVVKKVIKKVAAIRGKKPPILSSGERRAEQRQMNHAVMALRSVFPRRKG